jgi:hypothetical protein
MVGDERPGRVVVEVAALVGDLAVPGRHRRSGSTTVVRAPLLAGQGLLGGGQPGGGDPPKARIGHMSAVGGGGEASDPEIDTDCRPGGRQGPHRHLVARQDEHPPAPLAANLNGLDPALDPAVGGDPHVPDSLQIHLAGVGLPSAAITVAGPFDTVEPMRWLEPRIAGRLADFHPPVERGERPVQAAQRRLLGRERPHRRIGADLPDLFELSRLVPIRDAGSPHLPGVPSFLQSCVVQLAVRGQALPQGDMLTRGRPQPEHISSLHSGPHRHSMRRRTTARRRASVMTRRSYGAGMTLTATPPGRSG